MVDQSVPQLQINLPRPQLEAFCIRHHIKALSVFGSVLRDDFTDDSDVDVLVDFEEGHTPDFFALYFIEQELSKLLGGREIDLVTRRALNPHLREGVLASELRVYGKNYDGIACIPLV